MGIKSLREYALADIDDLDDAIAHEHEMDAEAEEEMLKRSIEMLGCLDLYCETCNATPGRFH